MKTMLGLPLFLLVSACGTDVLLGPPVEASSRLATTDASADAAAPEDASSQGGDAATPWDASTTCDQCVVHERTCTSISVSLGTFNPCGDAWALAYSPDGALLAVAKTGPNDVQVWRTSDGSKAYDLHAAEGHAFAVVFSPDGRLLAAGGGWGGDRVALYDATSGALVRSLAVSSGLYVGALAFSPDGALVATGGDVGPVEVWRSSDGVRVLAIDIPGSVHAVRFAPSGTQLVVSSVLGRTSVWNLADGSQAREFEDSVHGRSAASPSPDSAWLAISGNGGELQVWDFRTGVRTQTLTGHAGGSMGYLEWIGPDLLLSNDWDGTVRSWPRGAQGTLVPGGVWELSDPGLPQQLYGLAVAPGGARFAAGGVRGGVAGFSFGAL
jgi:WD40 repeat protein